MCPDYTVITAGQQERILLDLTSADDYTYEICLGTGKYNTYYNTRTGTMACAKRRRQLLYRAAIAPCLVFWLLYLFPMQQ
jgi:hypothetical protein